MAKYVKPYGNVLLVLPEPKREKTEGGMIIPDSATDIVRLIWGKVVRANDKFPELEVNDRVYFPAELGVDDVMDGILYKWLSAKPEDNMIWGIERDDDMLKAV